MLSLQSLVVGLSTILAASATPLLSPASPDSHQLAKRLERGPVISSNFPDPSITYYNGMWYSFATNSGGVNIQVATSRDFYTWQLVKNANGTQKDALPAAPAWVNMTAQNKWAPDVSQLDDGTFIMYYAASTLVSPAHHCVGAATSKTITGPYLPQSTPLYCPLAQGGAIDPAGYKEMNYGGSGWRRSDDSNWGGPSKRYVVYKVDGNSIGHGGICGNTVAPIVPTPIMLQQVAADGYTPIGANFTILDNNGVSDDGLVEAPSLVKSGNQYVLFFSSGCYSTNDYNVNYATASSITGPYTRYGPLLKTGDYNLTAPGGASIYSDGRHMVFHADDPTVSNRAMYIGLVNITQNHVAI